MQVTSSGQGADDETVRENRFEFTSRNGLAVCLNVVKSPLSSSKQKALAMKCICRFGPKANKFVVTQQHPHPMKNTTTHMVHQRLRIDRQQHARSCHQERDSRRFHIHNQRPPGESCNLRSPLHAFHAFRAASFSRVCRSLYLRNSCARTRSHVYHSTHHPVM